MYKSVLLPIDPGHDAHHVEALKVARGLAGDDGTITVIAVIEPLPTYVAASLPNDLHSLAEERAHAAVRALTGADGDLKTHVLHGRAGYEIVAYATRNDHDCIVIASHKPELTDYFLGSTAGRVVRHAQCSVHVIR